MLLSLRKFVALLLVIWLPLFSGATLAGSVSMQMTVVAIMAGLLPILWSTGTGSEVMRRIAAPMVGGMLSSAVLTLLVIPVLFALAKRRQVISPL